LRGLRFANDEEVKDVVQMYLRPQPKSFLVDWVFRLATNYTISVGKSGNFLKKLHIILLPQTAVLEIINKFTLHLDCFW
jgi:hypothetical protein